MRYTDKLAAWREAIARLGHRRPALRHGRACSICAASESSVASSKGLPTSWIDVGTPLPSNPHGTTAAGWPVTLNIAWNGTRAATASVEIAPRRWYAPMRDGPVAVPGVMTTSTSS